MTDHPTPKLYLDANIFISALERQNEQLMRLFAGDTRADGQFLFTSALTKAEVLVLPYREGGDRLISVYENWTESDEKLKVGPIDSEVLRYAAVLRAQYKFLKLPDAIHLSTALGLECTHFVSFDAGLARISQITHQRYGLHKSTDMPRYVSPNEKVFASVLGEVLL